MENVEIILGVAVFVVIALVAGWVLFNVARRTMKLVVRVVIFSVIVVALLVGGVAWWLSKSGNSGRSGGSNRSNNSRRR
jgi:high-affinity Fe2+/Pb2+ permease